MTIIFTLALPLQRKASAPCVISMGGLKLFSMVAEASLNPIEGL